MASSCSLSVPSTKKKDGDLSTSWTCTGDLRDPSDTIFEYDCTVYFDLFSHRHIKEVRIGEKLFAENHVSGAFWAGLMSRSLLVLASILD